jgi:hypothetical protein
MGSGRNLKREILTGKEDKGTKAKLELFKLSPSVLPPDPTLPR